MKKIIIGAMLAGLFVTDAYSASITNKTTSKIKGLFSKKQTIFSEKDKKSLGYAIGAFQITMNEILSGNKIASETTMNSVKQDVDTLKLCTQKLVDALNLAKSAPSKTDMFSKNEMIELFTSTAETLLNVVKTWTKEKDGKLYLLTHDMYKCINVLWLSLCVLTRNPITDFRSKGKYYDHSKLKAIELLISSIRIKLGWILNIVPTPNDNYETVIRNRVPNNGQGQYHPSIPSFHRTNSGHFSPTAFRKPFGHRPPSGSYSNVYSNNSLERKTITNDNSSEEKNVVNNYYNIKIKPKITTSGEKEYPISEKQYFSPSAPSANESSDLNLPEYSELSVIPLD